MFKKENRLVPGVRFNSARSIASPQFVLKEKRNGLAVNRFGIVVSKKIDKRAVVRNSVKRFFRKILLELYGKMSMGHDMLFIVRKGMLEKTEKENKFNVENALGKIGIINKN